MAVRARAKGRGAFLPVWILAVALAAAPGVRARAAGSPPTTRLTLAEAQRIALANHPSIKRQAFDVAAAEQVIDINRSAYLPQVGGVAGGVFAPQGTRIGASGGLNDPTITERGSVGLGASQLVTDFGRVDALVEASRQELQAETAKGTLTDEMVLLQATESYYNALRAEALQRVAATTLGERETLLKQIKSLEEAKLRSLLDVSIAEQDVDQARQLVLEANNRFAQAMATLAEALGYSDVRNFSLEEPKSPSEPPATMDDLIAQTMSRNPELQTLRAQSAAAQARVEAAKDSFYPTISAEGFAGVNPIRTPDQRLNPSYVAGGVVLTVPLFTGGSLTAQQLEAADEAGAAAAQLDTRRNQLLRDVQIAFSSLRTAYGNILVTRHMQETADQSLRLTEARYQIGSSSIVDLSDVQLRKTRADISYTDALYEYMIRQAALDFVTGVISVAN